MENIKTPEETLIQIRKDVKEADYIVANLSEHDRVGFESWKKNINKIKNELMSIDAGSLKNENIRNELANLIDYIDTYIENNNDLDHGSNRERYLHRTLVKHFIERDLLSK